MSVDTLPVAEAAANVAAAVETVASHLHPVASYDLAHHPRPTGQEEVWRFTPLKRLGGLLDAEGRTGGHLDWQVDAPAPVTTTAGGADGSVGFAG